MDTSSRRSAPRRNVMVERSENEPARTSNRTISQRTSEREMLTTRTFDAPSRLVFEAWTTPELFRHWWVPRSSGATEGKTALVMRELYPSRQALDIAIDSTD